jgi:large subunit ribosomal protein L10
MPKPEKVDAVKDIKGYLEQAKSVFITDYSGLNVADITALRKNLRENSIKYLVAKNTLMKIAAQDAGMNEIVEFLQGPTALAFGTDDPAVVARILYDSYKDKDKPVIKAFVMDNQLFDGADVKRLASLPSREILLAELVSAIESPLTSIIGSVDAVARELVSTIDALAASKK